MTKDGDRTPIISGCANYLFIHFFSFFIYVCKYFDIALCHKRSKNMFENALNGCI